MINTKLQSIIDTKSAIGNAITNKGGTITTNTPFFNYAAQIDGISTGTPQTIFAASDGSKWARTNAVNLVNSAGNVTSDFNYWQPANNSTSDPILNIGTVGANISGNIRLVPVNQVNQAQYNGIVATDINGAKYHGYNGIDNSTNPTPSGNVVFNRWVLNNSASGTVIFANAIFVNGGTFNGPNSSSDETVMPFVGNTANYGATVFATAINNGFIYAGGGALSGVNRGVSKFHESNLVLSGNTVNYGGPINDIKINNGFVYVGGQDNQTIQKFHESNLSFVGNTPSYGGTIREMAINNGFIYAGGVTTNKIRKYHESNLAFDSESVNYGQILSIGINDGFVYAGGFGPNTVQKFHESNLAFDSESANYGSGISRIAINNGSVFVGGDSSNMPVKKYHESNLSFVGSTPNYGTIFDLIVDNGFIYVTGFITTNSPIRKYYESNLAFVVETLNNSGYARSLSSNNNFIYAGGQVNTTIKKYQQSSITLETLSFFNITTIKE